MSNTITVLTTVVFILGLTSCGGGGGDNGDGTDIDAGYSGWSGTGGGSGTACGNGVIDYGEECDGQDLGGETCNSLEGGSGTLQCDANCRYDLSMCTQATVTSAGYGG